MKGEEGGGGLNREGGGGGGGIKIIPHKMRGGSY